MQMEQWGVCDINRRDFLHAAGTAALAVPVWLGAVGRPHLALAAQDTAACGDYFAIAFGIGDADCRKVLKRAMDGGGDFADLFFQHSVSNWIVLENGKVNRAFTSVALGMGVRVVRGQRSGYAFTQALDLPVLLETAANAAALAAAGGQNQGARGVEVVPPALKPGLDLYPVSTPWDEVPVQQRMDLVRQVESRIFAADKRIVKATVQLRDTTSQVMVVTSQGVKRCDMRPRTGLVAGVVAEDQGRRENNHYDVTARAGVELFSQEVLAEIADGAVDRTIRLFEARPLRPGEMPLVMAAGSSGILLHEAIGHGLEADFNKRNISTFSGRLGQKVAGPEVTVVDDGTIAASHGAINFDDEGSDSQRTILVEKGLLKSYLHDRMTADFYKTATTGNCRRQSFEYAPMPRMRATYMEPGPHKAAEIIASVKDGLYAEQFTNGQVDIGSGSFSFYVKSGWAIEGGKLTYPVKDINVIGNGPEVLGRITMVADDLALARSGFTCGKMGQSVPVSQGLPTALVSSINVGGAHG